jgi:alpha-ketoglutarate-dependent taurine dioxygenase
MSNPALRSADSQNRNNASTMNLNNKVSFLNNQQLPAVIDQKVINCDVHSLIDNSRDQLKELEQKYGAVLLRGFDLPDAESFSKANDQYFALDMSDSYTAGAAPRKKVLGNVYNSTDLPPSYTIRQHSEMAYVEQHPSELLFFCNVPAAQGGETPLTSTRKVLESIDKNILDEFERKGVQHNRFFINEMPSYFSLFGQYRRHMNYPRLWQEAFETNSREEVNKVCAEGKLIPHWNEKDGSVIISTELPAVRIHPKTHERVWFNQAVIMTKAPSEGLKQYLFHQITFFFDQNRKPYNTRFGDGSIIPTHMLRHIEKVTNDLTIKFSWQQGDLLIVDNYLTMHGRMPFKGERSTLVGMSI